MARATGRTHYIVDDDSFGDADRFRVTRINSIGQGWVIATYSTAKTARDVAEYLNARARSEASS